MSPAEIRQISLMALVFWHRASIVPSRNSLSRFASRGIGFDWMHPLSAGLFTGQYARKPRYQTDFNPLYWIHRETWSFLARAGCAVPPRRHYGERRCHVHSLNVDYSFGCSWMENCEQRRGWSGNEANFRCWSKWLHLWIDVLHLQIIFERLKYRIGISYLLHHSQFSWTTFSLSLF